MTGLAIVASEDPKFGLDNRLEIEVTAFLRGFDAISVNSVSNRTRDMWERTAKAFS